MKTRMPFSRTCSLRSLKLAALAERSLRSLKLAALAKRSLRSLNDALPRFARSRGDAAAALRLREPSECTCGTAHPGEYARP
jgi:hypothetical protein